jgi:hypothetical protein
MRNSILIATGMLIFGAFSLLYGQTLDAAPQPPSPPPTTFKLPANGPSDSFAFHRGEDFAFGTLIAMPVGIATRPAVGFWAAEAAGIANEARYGKNFNVGHLAVITAGAGVGYGLARWEKHVARKAEARAQAVAQ